MESHVWNLASYEPGDRPDEGTLQCARQEKGVAAGFLQHAGGKTQGGGPSPVPTRSDFEARAPCSGASGQR